MKNYIALLRGINVGGHKKVPMAELRELLSNSGFENVKTYIQTGNVFFQSSEESVQNLEQKIHEAIVDYFGFEVSVLVKTRQDIQRIFDACPFSEEVKTTSYFMMLHTAPNAELIKEAYKKVYEGEFYQIIDDCLYFYSTKGYGQSKFNMNYFEKKLETASTTRNYKTMVKLLSLSEEN